MRLPAFPWFADIDRGTLRADALAGLLGAVLVLPQALAFATMAGLPPQYGLYTAVLPCIVAALAGSSRLVMSGPTNANSLALYAMLAPLAAVGSSEYVQLALVVTLLVGAMELAIGLLRLGTIANFISPAALQGFTGGAAVLIVVHALHDLLGLALPAGQGAAAVLEGVATSLDATQPAPVVVAAVTLVATLAVRRIGTRWPAMLVGLAAGSAAGAALSAWSDWTPVRVVGSLPSAWPPFDPPRIDWRRLPELMGLAFALSIVALGQSFAIAKELAARTGERVDTNREFAGQGLSNLVGGLFSSYVSCGSMNRSLLNLEAGARTPLASVLSALLLLAMVALGASVLAFIPMAAIAALMLLIAWTLFDATGWRALWRASRGEFAIAAVTLGATLSVRLEVAILFGTMLSLVAYLHRTSRPAMRTLGFTTREPGRRLVPIDDKPPGALPECPQLKLLRMEGSVYFGATAHVSERLHELREGGDPPRHLAVMIRSMNFVDVSGAELWRDELRARRALGGDLYFHQPRDAVLDAWRRTGFLDELGAGHVFASKADLLMAVVPGRLDLSICERCTARIFHECPPPPPGNTPQPGTRNAENP